jgi:membrane protease YdiL (CAAX protease family)
MTTTQTGSRGWTAIGLLTALFLGPVFLALYRLARPEITTFNVTLRELTILAMAGLLALIIRFGERLPWSSVGLARPRAGNTALWVLITLLGAAAAVALAFGVIHLLDLRPAFKSPDALAFERLPPWVILLVVMRAGFVEEFFYRGYAIERLEAMSSSRFVSAGLPLLLFAVVHYRQGWAGILIALFTGAVLTAVYLKKRNLWINVTAHFLVDFLPNVLIPFFVKSS